MSEFTIEEGAPIRLSDLNIEELAIFLHSKNCKTTAGKRIMPLHNAHLDILENASRFTVLAAGRRFSKTLLGALSAIAILMQPNRRVWIVAPTYNHAEKVFKEVHAILVNQLGLVVPGTASKKDGGSVRNQKGDYYIRTPWGSVLEAKSMERPDSLAGEALDFIIVDEAALQPDLEDIWVQMLAPTLVDKQGGALIISSPRGRNDFYKLYLQGQLGKKQKEGLAPITVDPETKINNDMRDWMSFKKTSYDNPMAAGSPEQSKAEIDARYRDAIQSGKVIKFKQEYLADFDSVSDIVFPEFVSDKSEDNPIPNIIDYNWHPDEGPVFTASDYNYARPASTIFLQVNDNGDCVVFDEKFTPRTTSYQQAQQVLEYEDYLSKQAKKIWAAESVPKAAWTPIEFKYIIGDISGDQSQLSGRTAFDDFEEVLGRRPKGLKQSRQTGCDLIRHMLAYPVIERGIVQFKEDGTPKTVPKLFITRNCVNLIFALSTAKFKQAKHGVLKEDYGEIPGGYEGLLDALRYALVFIYHDRGQFAHITGGIYE